MADTIFALSSGRAPAAIGIVRISGPAALATATTLAGSLPPARRAALRRLTHDGHVIDGALVIVFPGPASATGEDLVELHCHGGRAVIAAVEAALASVDGVRRAEAGEFTRRALLNGRIDLAEAQGLADLLAAETEAQRRAAMASADGRLSRAVREWMDRVTLLAAEAEAALDFADEDDVAADPATLDGLRWRMQAVARDIADVLAAPAVDRLRDGIRVVLAGPPNSGKSTLLNLLAERQVAIVSPIAGTTRDRVEAPVARRGLPFILTDTAGLNDDSDDPIERIGIELAGQAAEDADILLWLGDSPPRWMDAIWLHARADMSGRQDMPPGPALAVRSDTPGSVEGVWNAVVARAGQLIPRPDQLALNAAQRARCGAAENALRQSWDDPLIGAELLRQAHFALAEMLGVNATEAMLDALFGRFCIGK